jgi:hypothetical protein
LGDIFIGPSWFLISLFFVKILSSYTIQKGKYYNLFFIIAFSFLSIFLKECHHNNLMYAFFSVPLCYPFYIFGYYLKKTFFETKCESSNSIIGYGLIISIIITCIVSWFNPWNLLSRHDYGNNILLFYIGGISGSFMIIFLSFMLKDVKSKIISNLNKGLVILLVCHKLLIVLIFKIAHYSNCNIIIACLISLFIIVILYPIIIYSIKNYPILIGYRK